MASTISTPYKLIKGADLDFDYGPFNDLSHALINIPIERRALGKTVAVFTAEGVVEYQFKSGVKDSDLVLKQSSGEAQAVTWDSITGKPTSFTPATHSHAWGDITGKPTTFAPVIGTTATTAKAGNYVPTWAEITGKPATFAPTIGSTATTAMAGNTALLQIGTTATTAKAGNYRPTIAEITDAFANIDETQREAIKVALGLNA